MKFIIPILFLLSSARCQSDDIEKNRQQFGDLVKELWQSGRPNVTQNTTPAPVPGSPTWVEGSGTDCICVEYYNCDADTNTLIKDGKIDGFGVIDIRFGQGQGASAKKCEHYLDVCCMPGPDDPNTGTGGGDGPIIEGGGGSTGTGTGSGTGGTGSGTGGGTVTVRPTVPPTKPTVTPPPLEGPVKCGIRNPKGVGFSIKGNENHESEYAEFPWMVALLRKDYNYNEANVDKNLALCGASLINEHVVLTGAHCVDKFKPEQIRIRAGEWDTQTAREQYPYQERDVKQIIIHENFNPKTVYNDIALLILSNPVEYAANVKPVCLPRQGEVFHQSQCFVTGWGKTSFGKLGHASVILKKIDLPIVNNKKCEADLRKTRLGKLFNLHSSFICAGGEEGKDACTGDGGGPLVCPDGLNSLRYQQAGIIAWGIGCGQANVPGVYGNVAMFRDWIDSHMKKLGYGITSYTV